MSAVALRSEANVHDIADGMVESEAWPLVPDGDYLAVYVGHDCINLRQFKQSKVFLRFRLFDAGAHTGKILFRAYRVRRILDGKRFVVGRRSDLLHMVCQVMDHRTRPDRISLRELKRHILKVRTRTVIQDGKQRPLPLALRYSVVDDILGKETS